mgnify:CR=1 FL=1
MKGQCEQGITGQDGAYLHIASLAGVLWLVLVLLLSLRGIASFWTDYLWFDSVGFAAVWRTLIFSRVLPTPYQLLICILDWVQLNTQGMALRSSSVRFPLLLAGRDPILLDSITSMGVAC